MSALYFKQPVDEDDEIVVDEEEVARAEALAVGEGLEAAAPAPTSASTPAAAAPAAPGAADAASSPSDAASSPDASSPGSTSPSGGRWGGKKGASKYVSPTAAAQAAQAAALKKHKSTARLATSGATAFAAALGPSPTFKRYEAPAPAPAPAAPPAADSSSVRAPMRAAMLRPGDQHPSLLDANDAAAVAKEVAKWLSRLALFVRWNRFVLEALITKLPRRNVKRYEQLYREGQTANAFYIILSGSIVLTQAGKDKEKRPSAAAAGGGSKHALYGLASRKAKAAPLNSFYDSVMQCVVFETAVYEETTLTQSQTLGTEALAFFSTAPSAAGGCVPRAHTATATEPTTVLVLPHIMLRNNKVLKERVMVHGTVRRAQLTTMQQAFARAPVFCVNQRPLLQRLATHFELRVYERNETIVEEGKRVEFFCMVHQGSVATYKRAAWGVMQYAVSHGRTKAAEEYVETIGHDAGMPFFGEEALLAAPDYRGMGGQELGGDVAKVTVRAAERTCLFAMPREHAVAFLREFTQFGELMIQQRADSKRSSLRADAMNQAFAQAKAARSGARFEEVEEALERARAKDRRDAEEKRAKARGDPVKRPYVPKPKSPPHPHSPPRDRRGRVEDAARRTMFTGIEVHQVASRMGLVDEAKEETKSTFVGSTLRRASAEGGAAPAEEAPLTEEEKKALASQAFFSAVRKVKPSVYNPLVDGKRPEHWGPAGAAAPPG